jgi:AcrR family transcriptional regulator
MSSTDNIRRDANSHSPRKRAMLEAAIRSFRARGYHGTTIREIGAAAGLTSAALYRHFANKDELLEAAAWAMAREIAAASRQALAQTHASPRDALRALVRATVEVALRDRDQLAVYLSDARYLPAESFAEMQRSEREYRDLWMHTLRQARPGLSETRARVMASAALSMAANACVVDPELDATQLADLITSMALAAMLEAE